MDTTGLLQRGGTGGGRRGEPVREWEREGRREKGSRKGIK